MRIYRVLMASLLVVSAGCSRFPDSYPPPEQRQPLAGSDLQWIGKLVKAEDPTFPAYAVRDVSPALQGNWRWCNRRPELRFYLDAVEHLSFVLDFAIPDAVIDETGPLTFSYFINRQLLAKVHYPKAGEQHFSQAVPPAMLKAHAENLVAIEPDKVLIAKADGVNLSFLLMRAGFVE